MRLQVVGMVRGDVVTKNGTARALSRDMKPLILLRATRLPGHDTSWHWYQPISPVETRTSPRTVDPAARLDRACCVAAENVARTDAPLAPNAAELWGATLPGAAEVAIRAERVRREASWDARQRARRHVLTSVVSLPAPLPRAALVEAGEEQDERPWAWLLASAAFLVVLVATCARLATF